MKQGWIAALSSCLLLPVPAFALNPGQQQFRDIYRELVETNTTLSAGSCTVAAQKVAARLKAAGYPDGAITLFSAAGHPREGGIVALLPGSDPKAKAILLLAHLDVVEANRADWTRDPFKLVEENGYFYGRGTADDKSVAAAWIDTMLRFRTEKVAHRRPLKLALTCGEETNGAFNGAEYLARNKRGLIDAEFGLTEGGWGTIDAKGKRIALGINAGEKLSQNYTLEVTNPGGHSMRPVKDNALYRLSAALLKIGAYDFPVQTLPVTREYFGRMAPLVDGEIGQAMAAFAKNPSDTKAIATLEKDPRYNATLRTTCVATMSSAGHATNALPQRATANINCRIFPGSNAQHVKARLQEVIGDGQVKITVQRARNEPTKVAPPLTPAVMQPIIAEAGKRWSGVPVIPQLEIGATDASFLTPAGIPTYGFTAMFFEPDGSRLHGLNERIRSDVLYQGRDFLFELLKTYTK